MNEPVTAIVLAGGRSSRMGKNKLFLELEGMKFIDRVIHLLYPIFNEIIFISNTPEDFSNYQFKVYRDLFPFYGPLAGIHSGLVHSTTEYNFVISIDMPFISVGLINFLIENSNDTPVTLPVVQNKLQPLCGIYGKVVISRIETLFKKSSVNSTIPDGKINVRLFDLLNSIEIKQVDVEDKKFYHQHLFHNVNTIEDYYKAVEIAGKLKAND